MCIQSFFFYFVPCPPKIKLVLYGIREKYLSLKLCKTSLFLANLFLASVVLSLFCVFKKKKKSLEPCKTSLILGGQGTK